VIVGVVGGVVLEGGSGLGNREVSWREGNDHTDDDE